MFARPSAIALALANVVPLLGVLFLDWRVFDVMILYWAENVVIGVINVLRMLSCKPGLGLQQLTDAAVGTGLTDTQKATISRFSKGASLFLIPFFIVHYGMFCFGHYSAVVGIFGRELATGAGRGGLFGVPLVDAWQSPLWIGVAAIAVSHLISFRYNFIGKGEYRRTNLVQLMQRPYGRIIILHVSVIAGGFLVTLIGNPLPALAVLIAVKIAIDLRMHSAERRVFAVE